MTLASTQLDWLAHLARIELTAEEKSAALDQINNFFTLVEKIQPIDTKAITPLAHPLAVTYPLAQRLRKDNVTESNQTTYRDRYQNCAPETAEGFYLVPKVVE
jgi:aspartyl-tRNA(Asn)/glutamyl-tRNA(Gln) amidotransferase subunit C